MPALPQQRVCVLCERDAALAVPRRLEKRGIPVLALQFSCPTSGPPRPVVTFSTGQNAHVGRAHTWRTLGSTESKGAQKCVIEPALRWWASRRKRQARTPQAPELQVELRAKPVRDWKPRTCLRVRPEGLTQYTTRGDGGGLHGGRRPRAAPALAGHWSVRACVSTRRTDTGAPRPVFTRPCTWHAARPTRVMQGVHQESAPHSAGRNGPTTYPGPCLHLEPPVLAP